MNAPPSDEPSATPKNDPDSEGHTPTPSEGLSIVLNFLRHYWVAPRHKAKWTEGATVILMLLTAGAALYSAWIFYDTLVVGQRPWLGIDFKPIVEIRRQALESCVHSQELRSVSGLAFGVSQ
jgi:hypothetical protein